jgi:MoaA/NifB/PqqE/SkfB family radical SAM enzyme
MKVIKLNSNYINTLEENITNESKLFVSNSSFSQMNTIGNYLVDKKFANHFKQLKQVFMYITDRCNIACEQCIYKPSINHYINEEIPLDDAIELLKTFKKLGASKVTFLGGEPTLYGYREERKPLLNLIDETKKIGYEYIRIDTNGQTISQLLSEPKFKQLNEIAFSVDGFSKETNDMLRGNGTFEKAVKSIKRAINMGYKVSITCCVHKLLLTKDDNDIFLIEKMIRFAENLGVYQINFHDLFKAGVPMDTWTGDFAPSPEEWVIMYDEISQKISNNHFEIDIRLPQCFVTKQVFEENAEYFGYCPVKLGERVMVHPNGIIRICSNLICTGFGVARYENRNILWDNTHNNEIAGHDLNKNTPCTNRSRHRKYGKLVPLCFSFKPNQNEYVWKTKLNWDNNNSANQDG